MTKRLFMKGNEALAMAAIEAGCRYYFGYPITPQSDIPEYMSRELPSLGGEFIQAESEIASINMLLGASATGVRAMTSSSSPGISLKQEGISYMAGAELPGVIVNICRSGPGLGGIDASQADYFQAVKGGGHGGYHIIVLAPSSVQEMYDLTMLAFDLSDIYRMPAMVFGDSVIGQMKESLTPNPRPSSVLPPKDWIVRGKGDGEQRVVKSLYLGDGELEAHNWKLHARYAELKEKEARWEEFMLDDAEFLVTAFGSAARIAKTAVMSAREQGLNVGLLRPITLFPFPEKAYRTATARCKKVLDIELNAGQMVEDVRLSVAAGTDVFFYGRPPGAGSLPTPEELLEQIRKFY
ncbi:3-methyl-2-oxobutanoate dehydrogenase subunit VorB [Geobacter sulfurreducens]|uniref:2-oxoacid:ferredoxin oxidoreductase, alpha subunit n=1 Tax=Geobacter sulfurreducens (strain ATCC 51573 / DSM 12127 / PCA) TaxID=243231 RepID=Q74C15_GEOSL|nr:3-methyl-2-oxobutanoate dehydrogenase subunit VorB [Geobacter sulfurreducens]AAR35237.2 2-oxoacid:ferredoxin oxidoreductase, alpha subunit [Geobacter sulfurreducens PCA]UAC02604.1 3-methyl-2-oxobutanoate dehydrogenase subunit VorB [Geobacter sulfurreducens]HBB70226.1 3-methyl-2-oxobutanoate dehydrogenase subunit VorB [Geobacter sulfurreducens]